MISDQIFNKHRDHEVVINENPTTKKGTATIHLGALRCVTCNKHLKWLSGQELVYLGRITSAEWQQYQDLRIQARYRAEQLMLSTQSQPVQDSW